MPNIEYALDRLLVRIVLLLRPSLSLFSGIHSSSQKNAIIFCTPRNSPLAPLCIYLSKSDDQQCTGEIAKDNEGNASQLISRAFEVEELENKSDPKGRNKPATAKSPEIFGILLEGTAYSCLTPNWGKQFQSHGEMMPSRESECRRLR